MIACGKSTSVWRGGKCRPPGTPGTSRSLTLKTEKFRWLMNAGVIIVKYSCPNIPLPDLHHCDSHLMSELVRQPADVVHETSSHSVTSETSSRVRAVKKPKLWVVLPAFNEQEGIESLLRKIQKVGEGTPSNYEIVVVDDASTDATARIVSQLSFEFPVSLEQHRENQGLAGALRSGFEYALNHGSEGDIVVTMDADDTQPPATIPEMLTMIDSGYDVVIASRYRPGSRTIGVPWNRQALTWVARWMFKTITPIPGVRDYTCGFRAYRFDKLKQARDFYGEQFISEEGFSCMVDVLLKMRPFRFVMGEVPMLLRYDQKQGPSKMKVANNSIQTVKLLVKRRLGK